MFVRVWNIPTQKKTINLAPMAGGVFMALAHAHDLPIHANTPVSRHDPAWLLRHGQLFIHNMDSDHWSEVSELSQLKGFSKEIDESWEDGFTGYNFLPYPVEFYFVPRSARAKAHLARSKAKAFR